VIDQAARQAELVAVQGAFDELFFRDGGAELARYFLDDAEMWWPGEPPIVGSEAIGAALDEFAGVFEIIDLERHPDLIEASGSLGVVMRTFSETRRVRETGILERIHGRSALVWRRSTAGEWRCARLMTGRYAPDETMT